MKRLYFTSDDVSEALMKAGIAVQPKDCLVTKFNIVAEELGKIARQKVRDELENFQQLVCWEKDE